MNTECHISRDLEQTDRQGRQNYIGKEPLIIDNEINKYKQKA